MSTMQSKQVDGAYLYDFNSMLSLFLHDSNIAANPMLIDEQKK